MGKECSFTGNSVKIWGLGNGIAVGPKVAPRCIVGDDKENTGARVHAGILPKEAKLRQKTCRVARKSRIPLCSIHDDNFDGVHPSPGS